MASRFWVGGNGNTWHVTAGNTNWSATSGGAPNATEPTNADTAFFDNAGAVNMTGMNTASAVCAGIDFVTGAGGPYVNTFTHDAGITIGQVSASTVLTLGAGMTYTATAGWTKALVNSNTLTVTTAGKTISTFTLSGITTGTVISFQDDFNGGAACSFSVRGTTLQLNGHTIRVASLVQSVSGAVYDFGSNAASKFTITAAGTVLNGAGTWNNLVAGNEIRFTSASASSKTAAFGTSFNQPNLNITYASGADNLIFTAATALTLGTVDVSGSATNGLTFPAGITTTVAGLISSSSATGSAIKSSTPASTYTISCANPVRVNALSVTDCIAAGAGNPFYTVCGTLSNTTNWNIARTNHLPLLAVA